MKIFKTILYKAFLTIAVFIFLLYSCSGTQEQKSDKNVLDVSTLDKSKQSIPDGDLEKALKELRIAFELGDQDPMIIIMRDEYRPLVDNPESRPLVRDLVKEFALSSTVVMVADDEKGTPAVFMVRVVNEYTGKPIPNANILMVHTDINGKYFPEEGLWNPRIFGYGKSATDGSFKATSIMPGYYAGDDGNYGPRHVHFNIDALGFRSFGGEFMFENDSLLTPESKVGFIEEGIPFAKPDESEDQLTFEVDIPLQPDR